jgi:hypothetical protein
MTLTAVLSKNARSTEVLPAFRGYLEGGRLAVRLRRVRRGRGGYSEAPRPRRIHSSGRT